MKYIHKKLGRSANLNERGLYDIMGTGMMFNLNKDNLLALGFEGEEKRPKKWEDLGSVEGYHINNLSGIKQISGHTKAIKVGDIFLTKAQAEGSLALAQITQLLGPNGYDVPEEAKIWYDIKGVRYGFPSQILPRIKILSFDTEEKRDHFVKHHQDLIDEVKVFYIL